MNHETAAAWKWLTSTPGVGDACNKIVQAEAWTCRTPERTIAAVGTAIAALVHEAFPVLIRPGEPDDWRETMRSALERVDWAEIGLLFMEQERWRAKGRVQRAKRKAARRRRK